jgi:O-antigen/teichoic acid export membrane protein
MLRSAALIVSGNAFTSVLTLARNLLVARLITVEHYGIAATFAISIAVVEMLSALGLQAQIVQARDGNDPRLQSGLQGFQMFRGLISATLLFFLARPMAEFMGIGYVTWAFQVLAVIPILNSLVHFDIYRMNRAMIYLPGVLSTTIPALASLLVVVPLFWIYGDYRVMLFAILVQSVLTFLISHLVAERKFRPVFDREIVLRGLKFGWPIMINSMVLFAVFNGEKLIVGREMGPSVLAIFAMGVTLTMTPALVFGKSAQTFFLPRLSAVQDDAQKFAGLALASMQVALAAGVSLILGVVVLGEPFVALVLGEKYAALAPLMVWLAILNGIRVSKQGASDAALSRARTVYSLIGNSFHVLTLPLSWYAAVNGADVQTIVLISIAGETVGLTVSMILVRNGFKVPIASMALPTLAAAVVVLTAIAHSVWSDLPAVSEFPRYWSTIACGLATFVTFALLRDARAFLTGSAQGAGRNEETPDGHAKVPTMNSGSDSSQLDSDRFGY